MKETSSALKLEYSENLKEKKKNINDFGLLIRKILMKRKISKRK